MLTGGRVQRNTGSDIVINVAGHRLGTREIEEAISDHDAVAEAAAVGVKDEYKGQVVLAYVVATDPEATGPDLEQSVKDVVDEKVGAIARPSSIHFVEALPKSHSGKMLRRGIQAVAESRDPGDLSSLEDPSDLESVRASSEE